MTHGGEMEESHMEGMMEWWEHIPEDKKRAVMKAKLGCVRKLLKSDSNR
jgi:hypothetical protein